MTSGALPIFSFKDEIKIFLGAGLLKDTMMKFLSQNNSRFMTSLVFIVVAGFFMSSAYASAPGLVKVTSHNSFGTTVSKLESAVSQNGLVILKKFNLQNMLNMVGVHAQKGMTFEIFHPRFGKTIYSNNPVGFLAVPLRVLVLQQGNNVNIYYQKPSVVLNPFGLSSLANQLDPLIANIASEAAK